MAEATMGSAGGHFRLTYTDDEGATTVIRLPLGSHTDQDINTITAALRNAYPTLRQWSQDAATTNTNWPNLTAAQKDAATRETIRRLGMFLDRFGDLLVALNADS